MQRALVFTLLCGLLAGVSGTACAAGYKHRSDLTGRVCATEKTDADSCNSACCELDNTKCGGLTGITCAWDQYGGNDDAWKNTPATDATKNTACCKPKVACQNTYIQMPVGMKSKGSSVASLKCASDANSCTHGSVCIEGDETKCGGFLAKNPTLGCSAVHADAVAQTGAGAWRTGATMLGANANELFPTGDVTGNTWKGTATGIVLAPAANPDSTNQKTNKFLDECCKRQLLCTGVTPAVVCPAGKKLTASGTAVCTTSTGAKSGDKTDCARADGTNANACCVADKARCGGWASTDTNVCSSGYVLANEASEAWKNKPTASNAAAGHADIATRTTDCCVVQATCASAQCTYDSTSGLSTKKRANVDSTVCPAPGTVRSCGTSSTCCETDTSKCGGLTGIACPYGFTDERHTWNADTPQSTKDAWNNKPATNENKNTNCCTAVAVCALPPIGTTTPAPVVTTTPAAPGLKFSERKIAIEEGSDHPWGTFMVSLGVGGLIGMSVLMVVKALRFRMQTREDADQLLDTSALE